MGMSIDESINWVNKNILEMRNWHLCTIDKYALNMAIETMRKYQTMQEVLEKVWNVPSCMLDEAECLNEIMEAYRTVR